LRIPSSPRGQRTLSHLPAHGQQAWGHGLGRSWRDLPPAVAAELAASVSDLEDRLRILDALYIPTRYPDSLPDGAPTDHHCFAEA
jgi:hypothetical protein